MSVNLNRVGGLEPPETTELDVLTPITVFTSSDTYGRTVETIVVANIGAAPCEVTLEWVGASTAKIFWHKDIPAEDTVIISEIPILAQGTGKVRSIRATAEIVDVIWITCISSAQTKQSPVAS